MTTLRGIPSFSSELRHLELLVVPVPGDIPETAPALHDPLCIGLQALAPWVGLVMAIEWDVPSNQKCVERYFHVGVHLAAENSGANLYLASLIGLHSSGRTLTRACTVQPANAERPKVPPPANFISGLLQLSFNNKAPSSMPFVGSRHGVYFDSTDLRDSSAPVCGCFCLRENRLQPLQPLQVPSRWRLSQSRYSTSSIDMQCNADALHFSCVSLFVHRLPEAIL